MKKLLQAKGVRKKMLLHFARTLANNPKVKKRQVQVYADPEEQHEMQLCHAASIELLNNFLDQLPSLHCERALEVAAGDGRVTNDLLIGRFTAIDCFDLCYESVKKLEQLQLAHHQIKKVDQAAMQSYYWEHTYSLILVRWCVGYLSDGEAVAFLKKARSYL